MAMATRVAPATRAALARGPVVAAMVALAVSLTATSRGYGYERDELYFRMLRPDWGYLDQPPLTPLVARATTHLADQTWALRLPATLASVLTVLILALVTRELGGSRFAQGLCAWGYAFAALPLAIGHVLLTATTDAPVWPAVLLFVLRAVLRDRPRWWLAAGAVVGLSMYNKLLVAVLILGLAAGLALAGPRRLLVGRWVLGGLAVALAIGAPNLVYQAVHGWPQFTVGRALAQHNGADVRVQMWTLLPLLLGPPLVPIWLAGLVHLWRGPARFVAVAFPVVLVLVFVMGTQPYYELELVAVLFAAGCVPTARWLAVSAGRRALVLTGVGLNAVVSAVIGLPLVPIGSLGSTPVPSVNQVAQDSVGWPRYVRQVAAVYSTLPALERVGAIVYASNYGEAGALDRYGPDNGLPRVYSGQNQLWYERRPPESARTAIVVGGQYEQVRTLFASCRVRARLDDGVDVDNEEQGEPIAVCTGLRGSWVDDWAALKHVD